MKAVLQFTEPNDMVCQIKFNGSFSDYASIKTPQDLADARRLVDSKPGEFRIVRQFTVVYPK